MGVVEGGEVTVTTASPAWPSHPPDHLIDLAEWDALPEDRSARYELVEGVLVVAPRPLPRHQDVVLELAGQLRGQVRTDDVVLSDTEIVVDAGGEDGPATVRAPDLLVASRTALDGRPRLRPDEVLMAVEVLSPGSRRTDRVAKLAEYAEVGIPHYVIVDPDGPITEFVLDGGAYRLVATHDRTAALTVGVTVSLPASPGA